MFENLNKMQKEAVEYINGPLLVLAGAGSGKTKVLTTRICNLIINHNVNPYNILAITFTNKAAKEMKDRVYNMINISNIQISTFHSFGVTILRKYYQLLGYTSNFTILDSDDTLAVIKKIMKDLDYDIKKYNPRIIRNMISSAKNEMITSSNYSKYANDEIGEIVKKVYEIYDTKLFNNNSLDFDDLLIKPIELFKKHKDVLEEYQEHYKYILIDEYQDTNTLQYTLTKMLADKYKNICVVGDNDQSIYAFRGANYKNILNFEKDYPNTKVILLEENYRSTKNILNVANSVIKKNIDRKDKNLWTNNDIGDKVIYHKSSNETDESYYVVSEVKKLLNSGINHNEIAVLYRTNSQSRTIEYAFLKENIPYKVIGSFYFYNRKEIKDLIAYLKLIYNYKDDTSLLRIINTPKRCIGEKTISNLSNNALLNNKSMYECIDKGKELEFKNLIEELRELQDKVKLTSLVDII
ncbi:MAG: UvrD-helicase domain-containing protein, partial [Bacilli bacterium]|nr:UvrD-helicase domain-containing protein [Bacilli bacterium]